ncbi:hypothetical protein TNCV_4498351 [Trichonephila clavipes]|nr:hypothetical protein TNCV_4498351 [Trichonephila clavipes]
MRMRNPFSDSNVSELIHFFSSAPPLMIRLSRAREGALPRNDPPTDSQVSTTGRSLKAAEREGKTAASYTRAFGDGPRHFEPWTSDEDDI